MATLAKRAAKKEGLRQQTCLRILPTTHQLPRIFPTFERENRKNKNIKLISRASRLSIRILFLTTTVGCGRSEVERFAVPLFLQPACLGTFPPGMLGLA